MTVHTYRARQQQINRRVAAQVVAGAMALMAIACTPQPLTQVPTPATGESATPLTQQSSTQLPSPVQAPTETIVEPTRLLPTAAPAASPARLQSRPLNSSGKATEAGVLPLGLHAERDTLLYVPSTYQPDTPAPMLLLFHGAGGNAEQSIALVQSLADEAGLLLLAPASRQATWDVIREGFGEDVALIDQALAEVFDQYAVDPARLGVGGFSDGASYALSLGISNGDLFTHIIAFSPGFIAPAQQIGTPRLFISHGTRDDVLPIDVCSRRIVPQVERAGYDVTYQEFDGPHTVPPEIARQAVDWYIRDETGEVTSAPAHVNH